jgi:hypothetical protein
MGQQNKNDFLGKIINILDTHGENKFYSFELKED